MPAAEATGKFTIRPYSVVHSLIYDPGTQRVIGVRVIDAQTRQTLEFRAKVVFLCASTLESARILLNSATPEFSTGLANSSGQVGRNLMDHMMGAGASGTIPGYEDRQQIGNRPNGVYVPRFRNIQEKHPDFIRGYGFQGGAPAKTGAAAVKCGASALTLSTSCTSPGRGALPLPALRSVCLTRKPHGTG